MQGSWNHERAHYRCRFPNEYAIANKLSHPLAVYVREDALVEPLDDWLTGVFAPGRVDDALSQLAAAQQPAAQRVDGSAKAVVADCDRKLARHRAALEAGADPIVVSSWIAEVQRERAVAVAQLTEQQSRKAPARLSGEEIKSLIEAFGGLLRVLRRADPADKAEVYRQLGVSLTYRHEDRTALAEVQPPTSVYELVVSEGRVDQYVHGLTSSFGWSCA